MNSTLFDEKVASDQTIVASYLRHSDAENAVRALASDGIPMQRISIIGRHYEPVEDVQGFFRPADGALQGASQGAWFGGLFGLMLGAFGFFVFPVVGGLMAIGPISGMIAGAVGGAGIGALIEGLVVAGIPRDQAIKYQDRLQAGEFLVVVHGSSDESMRAHEILQKSGQVDLQTHGIDLQNSRLN